MIMESFTHLSQSVYIREPQAKFQESPLASKNANLSPTTILFCAWMGALPRHYAKFLAYYAQTYPNARIVLVTSTLSDIFYRSYAFQKRQLEPAITAILSDSQGRLLVHSFSNGGANAFVSLLEECKKRTGKVLAVHTTVIDSAPGRGNFSKGINAIKLSVPQKSYLRLPILFLICSLLVVTVLIYKLINAENVIDRARRLLNDPAITSGNRCYIYSKEDRLVGWQDVEDHSHDAERKGYKVERVRFEGSDHVGHMRMDSQKYWSTIEEMWELSRLNS